MIFIHSIKLQITDCDNNCIRIPESDNIMDYEVDYYEDETENCENHDYSISIKTENLYFSFGEPFLFSNEDLDGMIAKQEDSGIGGEGRSTWVLYFKDGKFTIEYDICGSGGYSSFRYTFKDDEEILDLLKLIKKVNNLGKKNKRYNPSDYIKG